MSIAEIIVTAHPYALIAGGLLCGVPLGLALGSALEARWWRSRLQGSDLA